MRNLLILGALIFIFLSSTLAQTKTSSDRENLNQLKINTTTPEETVVVLGKPSEDTTGKLDYELFPSHTLSSLITGTDLKFPESWISPRKNETVFRKLVYNRNTIYKKIELSFLDSKLYLIDLTLTRKKNENLKAADLGELFQTDFVSIESIPKSAVVADYEKQKEPTIPKAYSKFYGMLSIAPTSILLAFADNDSFKAEFWSGKGKVKKELFPGIVTRLQIINRDVEKVKSVQ